MMRGIFTLILALMPFTAMAQDWSKPDLGSTKTNFMTEMHDIINACAKQDITGTNIPVGSIRYNRTSDLWEEWSGSAWATAPISSSAFTGGITGSMITDGTIQSADIADGGVQTADILDGTVGSADIGDGAVTSTDIANGTITGTDVQDGTIGSADITDDSLVAGDLAADSVGASEIAADAVGASEISAGAVGTSEIADNSIGGGDITDGTIGSSDIQDNSLTADDIATSAIGSAEINNGAILGEDIGADTIGTANIAANGVGTSELADGSVTAAKISGSWTSVTVDSSTLFDCGTTCGNGTSETGTLKYFIMGPVKYFYADLTYTFAGTDVDELGFTLPTAAGNANFTFFCTVGANNGEAVVGISNSGSTTQARLVKTAGNFGEGSNRNLKCSGFYE